jgi:hypothetical protein
LEPPTERLFNSDGTAAKRLNKAIAQVDAWRTFIEKHRLTVLRDLARFAQERDLVRGPRKEEPTCHLGWPLYHPRSVLIRHFDVVIGRRPALSERDAESKAAFKENHGIEVMTLDRFVDGARVSNCYESAGGTAQPVAPPNRRPASRVRMRRADRTLGSLPARVSGGGR